MTMHSDGPTYEQRIRPVRLGWKIGSFRPRLWALSWVLWTAFYLLPLWTGWLLKLVFDALTESRSIDGILAALGLSELVRFIIFAGAIYFVVRWWVAGLTLMRTNMLRAQTASGGERSARLPGSPAEAIARFSDDVRDAVLWVDSWLDGLGYILYGVGAVIIMSTIDLRAAFVVILPLVLVTVISRLLTPRLYAARLADRRASSTVTSYLGEMFTGQLAFRLAGREAAAVERLEQLTRVRRRTAVRDTVIDQSIQGIASSTADVTIGLTLLVLVPAVRRGDFSVGDLALFVAYAVQLGELPRFVSRIITSREQSLVAFSRMGELVADSDLDHLLGHCQVTIEPHDTMLTREPDPERQSLDRLEVRGLTALYADAEGDRSAGLSDVTFVVERGTFTVITGPVGSGKTTLVRAIIGLLPVQDGSILWNGQIVEDPAAWFVPPNCAHLPQMPRLFSESLAENITLGRSSDRLDDVLALTTLDRDLAEMPDGVHTMVGARGLRLSGGQAQRVATARSLFTDPELVVVDDLSSALDVTTERELWDRLGQINATTVIAVSQRQLAIDRADQVITMDAGRIISIRRR